MSTEATDLPISADDAELGLVAAALTDPRAFAAVMTVVAVPHFRSPALAACWRVLGAVQSKGEPWGLELMERESRHLGIDRTVASAVPGCSTALEALRSLEVEGSPGQAEVYAPIVVDAALRRHTCNVATRLLADARSGAVPPIDLAEQARDLAEGIEAGFAIEATGHASDLVGDAFDTLANPRGDAEGSLSWGLPGLDRMRVRIERGSYPIVAAMTGAGKTTLALQTAFGIAERTGRPVLYASLEMPAQEMARRAIIARSGFPAPTMGYPGTDAVEAWAVARDELRALPVFIPPVPDRTIDGFLRWLSAVARRKDFAAVFVDHLGLLRTKARDIYTSTTEVSQKLREWTLRGAQVPIVALAQLRRVERNQAGASRPPELFDLKDSGSLENDATAVVMIDRPWVRAATEDRTHGRVSETEAALYLKKNRDGATHRKVPLHFDGPRFRITESAVEPGEAMRPRRAGATEARA